MMPALFPEKLENVLILGGGDGLGARDLLKFPSVKRIDLVDLDPEILKFAKENFFMKMLNKGSFSNKKVKIVATDAKKWLSKPATRKYDLIIVDFPDPTSELLWGLYTAKLYKRMKKRMKPSTVIAVQSSTYNTRTFDLIFERLSKVFPFIIGYHTEAPSVFCGFFLASLKPIRMNRAIPASAKWINPARIDRILMLPVSKTLKKKGYQ
jgi:spermidine synthase